MTTNIKQTMEQIGQQAEAIRNDDHAPVSMAIGDVCRQGDLYLVRLGELPIGRKARKNRQLAEGDTQGSRHVLEGDAELFDLDQVNDLEREVRRACGDSVALRDYQIGPVFLVGEAGATVTHPEHGDRTLSEPGCYATIFQRSLTSDDREERARD